MVYFMCVFIYMYLMCILCVCSALLFFIPFHVLFFCVFFVFVFLFVFCTLFFFFSNSLSFPFFSFLFIICVFLFFLFSSNHFFIPDPPGTGSKAEERLGEREGEEGEMEGRKPKEETQLYPFRLCSAQETRQDRYIHIICIIFAKDGA